MKPSFHIRRLNGPFDDPGIYVRILRERRALIFDLGDCDALSAADILKLTDIFITHMHVDHFIGFDRVMRTCLRRKGPIRIYGPEGITGCVEGKMKGYTWNIAEEYPLVIEVYEVTGDKMCKAVFSAGNRFEPACEEAVSFDGVVMRDPLFFVKAVRLDHRISCLAYSLNEDMHINVDKSALQDMGLPVGPWLRDLKYAVRKRNEAARFNAAGRPVRYEDVRHICSVTRGQKISYVVDAAGTEENLRRINGLVSRSDLLYIEAFFLEKDRELARERCHLTASDAGRIAAEAGVGRVEPMHVSPRYIKNPEAVLREIETSAVRHSQGRPPSVVKTWLNKADSL